jgi:hypothetical protein
MGQAPKIIKELERTREQVLKEQQEWSLVKGELQADAVEAPADEPTYHPAPVEVPQQTFD